MRNLLAGFAAGVMALAALAFATTPAPAQGIDFGARGMAAKAVARQPALSSNRGTLSFGGPNLVTLTRASQTTFFYVFPVPAPYYAWRPIYANASTSATNQISGVAAAPSTTVNDYLTPTGGGAWTWGTMANGGSSSASGADLPLAAATSRAGAAGFPFTTPVATTDAITGQTIPSVFVGDWNYVSSLPATDGTRANYLFVRVYGPAQTWQCVGPSFATGYKGVAAVNRGFDASLMLSSTTSSDGVGDWVSTPGASPASNVGDSACGPLLGIQFLSDRPVVTLFNAGDSHDMGQTTAGGGAANYLVLTAWQLTKDTGVAVSPAVGAWGGKASDVFWPTALRLQALIGPQVTILPGWTANDANTTQGAVDKTLARMLSFGQRARGAGSVTIVRTPFCRDATYMATTGVLTQWSYLRTRYLDAGAHGAAVADVTPTLCSLSAGTYRTGLSTDAIHPSDAGTAAIVPVIEAAVRKALGF